MKKFLFTGGGSAGHVVPNVALIEDILLRGDAQVFYFGSNGIEKNIISKLKIPYYTIECPKLVRNGGASGFFNNLKIPTQFFRAVKEAEKGLKIVQPTAVFSKGGYVALPVVFAAKRLHIPCYAHESDFSLGLANQLSKRKCEKFFTSFPETAKKLKNGVYSGAPIKQSIFCFEKSEARRKLNIPQNAKVLLIFGGGSGSEIINQTVRKNLVSLTKDFYLLHVCGKGNTVQSSVKNYMQFEFVENMGSLYAAADCVVARSGAGTVFEIMSLKKPALFIPLQGQTRGDQKENADYFSRRGLCHVLSQDHLENFENCVRKLCKDNDLKKSLENSSFTSGNATILRYLYKGGEI
jgi:UDP-N-acetylglucosamine--N-acetylmuramyl-(pentapeptide) pyrophosphoryl-undecaprenol N-acetylglucosamine transferase